VVPFVTNAPGAFGVINRCDVFIANRNSVDLNLTLTLYPPLGGPKVGSLTISPRTTVHLQDIVTSFFGLTNTTGQLVIRSLNRKLTFEANARFVRTQTITGESRQQLVLGIGVAHLREHAFLYGLSGDDGNLVTLGVANPNDTTVEVQTLITSDTGVPLYTRTDLVSANQNLTLPNIFGTLGIPPQPVQVEFSTSRREPIYGYGVELDDTTMDFEFEHGTAWTAHGRH
jgi:hypothetical protein